MAKKPAQRKAAITTTTKGLSGEPGWTGNFQGGAISAKALQALDRSLGPSEAFALSIDLQAAINAITTQFSKVPVRLFYARSMDEITSGDVVDFFKRPAPNYTTGTWISELLNWYELFGEIAGSVLQAGAGRINVLPLNPSRLSFQSPVNPKLLSDVQQWRYTWQNGIIDLVADDALVFHKNFNPLSPIRGLSPILAGVNEVSMGYEAVRYNKLKFQNDAIPSHLVVLPDAVSEEDREAFQTEYLAMHSTYGGNAHKAMFVSGTSVDIKPLSVEQKDAQYANLINLVTSRLAMLKKVPALEMGIYDKARFETSDAEREIFYENTLLNRGDMLTAVLQNQIVDRYFTNSNARRSTGKKQLTKALANRLEKARAEQYDSEILVVLDMDSLPIALKVKQSKLKYAQLYQQTFKVSPRAAAEEIGMEIEETPANNEVWVQSTEAPFRSPEDAQALQQPPQAPDEPQQPDEQPTATDEDKAAAKAFVKGYRKLLLDSIDAGRLPTLAQADALNTGKSETIHRQIRLDYVAIKSATNQVADPDEQKELVRAHLNANYNRAFFRTL